MKTFQFETNLKCASCEEKVRKELAKEPLVKEVSLDLTDPKRTLTIKAENPIAEEELSVLIKGAGFEATPKRSLLKSIFSFF